MAIGQQPAFQGIDTDHLRRLYDYLTELEPITEGDRRLQVRIDRWAVWSELDRRGAMSPGSGSSSDPSDSTNQRQ